MERCPCDGREDQRHSLRRVGELLVNAVDAVDHVLGILPGPLQIELPILETQPSVGGILSLREPWHHVVDRIEPLEGRPEGPEETAPRHPVERAIDGADHLSNGVEKPMAPAHLQAPISEQGADQASHDLVGKPPVLDDELATLLVRLVEVIRVTLKEIDRSGNCDASPRVECLAKEVERRGQEITIAAPVLAEKIADRGERTELLLAAEEELGRAEGARRHNDDAAGDAVTLEAAVHDLVELNSIAITCRGDATHEAPRPDASAVLLSLEEVVLVQGILGAHITADVAVREMCARSLPGLALVPLAERPSRIRALRGLVRELRIEPHGDRHSAKACCPAVVGGALAHQLDPLRPLLLGDRLELEHLGHPIVIASELREVDFRRPALVEGLLVFSSASIDTLA